MILWLDAQLSPSLAPWLTKNFDVKAFSVKEMGYRDAADETIFEAARKSADVVVTKDRDFVHLVDRVGPPPKVLWLTMGNTSNKHLKSILETQLKLALEFLTNNRLVEITGE